jgi:hypothetical protein
MFDHCDTTMILLKLINPGNVLPERGALAQSAASVAIF